VKGHDVGDLNAWQLTAVAAAALLAAALLFAWLFPYRAFRLALWLFGHGIYRLRVHGREHLPAAGPALIVCNRVTHLDWIWLHLATPRRVRCVVFTPWAHCFGVGHILRWTGAIVIDGHSGVRGVIRALNEARSLLAAGEIVCVFAENRAITPHPQPLSPKGRGERCALPFRRVFERVARGNKAPVVPAALDQIWGSLFAIDHGKRSWRWPVRVPNYVEVAFAAPLPAASRAGDVRQAQQKLSADRAVARADLRRPAHRQFVRVAAHRPFRSCLIDSTSKGKGLTYGRTLAGAMCLANELRPLLGDNPTVGIWLPPSIGGAITNITLALLGKTSANLNYSASMEVVQSAIRQCGAKHVITAKRFTARMPIDPGPGVELIHLEDIMPKVTTFKRLRAYLAVLLLPGWFLEYVVLGLGKHHVEDVATLIFSSGSTGDPKGVMLTHGNIASNTESVIQETAVAAPDRLLGVLPFFHSFGYTVTIWTPLQVGASALYHPDPRGAKEIGELAREYGCTVYVSTATFLRFCVKRCQPDDFKTVRILVCGAEKLPMTLADEFQQKFGFRPLEGYGCTELSPVVGANLPDVEIDGLWQINNRPGTIGPPLPGVAAKIVHPETGEPLPLGEEGMLLIYGPNVMRGYLHKPELTAQVIRDGWYVTGDVGRLDADGCITLTGRLSRFAKVGGEMVPLERIEEELHDILNTTERVCAVTCVPDDARGERLVVLHLSAEGLEVKAWWQQLNNRGLPALWVPYERDFYNVAELPLLGSGKVNLKQVKELALEMSKKQRT
jgi:acyl-[acyl-carrier-protein]-phospholipid O-acyltransferase/long-chain-fatty-acid--[acyl-carrier-protein] ligase